MAQEEERIIMRQLENVREVLEGIGYKATAADEPALRFCIESTRSAIKNAIHCKNVPKGLEHVVICRTVGEFLKSKKTFAPGDLTMIDLEAAVKQIQEGDTNVAFAIGTGSLTPEQRLDNFISGLLNAGQDEVLHYRRLVW